MSSLSLQFAGEGMLLVFTALLIAMISRIRWTRKHIRPLPPGPKGYPIIGDLFGRPRDQQWKTYQDWGREYNSDIVATKILNQTIIILNSREVAIDLLEKRSSIYSSRPKMPMLQELMGANDWNISVFSYGPWWRQCRKLLHHGFHPDASSRYQPQEVAAVRRLLSNILNTPHNFISHLRHMSGALIMDITYGIDVLPLNDPYVATAEHVSRCILPAGIPGTFLVDILPILKHVPAWLPGAGFQKLAQHAKKATAEMMDLPFNETKREMESGTNRPSFVSDSFAKQIISPEGGPGQHEHAVRAVAGTLYAASTDTMVSVMTSAILGFLSNPAALKRAQKQIDEVVGRKRLPQFADLDELPWVTAIARESFRWNPVTPLGSGIFTGVPHYLSQDDEYKGYHLPSGSMIIYNAWGILHDDVLYPDPLEFKPERFIDQDKLNPQVRDPTFMATFGYGRRICPGRYMARDDVWITIAHLVAVFDICKACDKTGNTIEPTYEYTTDVISYPKPFPCSILPRDNLARLLIQEYQDV